MGFTRSWARLVFVLLWAGLGWSWAQTAGAAEISVLLLNHAKVSRDLIGHAEAEAARIFSASGIHLRWVDCSQTPVCHHVPGANEFVLSIVPDGRTSSELVYGVAFLGPGGEGKYADVFLRRVEAAANESGFSEQRLLGAVAAHELGHLLLGTRAHSYEGVMCPVWKKPVLQRMEMGSLLFTPGESLTMKGRLTSEGVARFPAFTQASRRLVP
ncbi:MAG: hypothetical protein ACJ713_10270 [Candidatus Sulfotelmatobacter sp.]